MTAYDSTALALQSLSPLKLLRLFGALLTELKSRGVIRTRNKPTGDYAEWLVSNALGLKLAGNSATGYDAVGPDGTRYQIKARQISPENGSRQLSAVRKYDERNFDQLIAVIFDQDFRVVDARQMPHETIGRYARFSKHVNAYLLRFDGAVLKDPTVTDLTGRVAGGAR